MGKTAAEKILARAAGRDAVEAGEIAWVKPDLATLPDASVLHSLDQLEALGLEVPHDSSKTAFLVDHLVQVNDDVDVKIVNRARAMARTPGFCGHFFDAGCGLAHQVPVEKGLIRPGMAVVSIDTHVTTLGALGAIAIPVNADVIYVLAKGAIWMKVPETVNIRISGTRGLGVEARDLILYIISRLGWETANYRVIQFEGPVIEDMSIDQRMTLCNGVVQIGAKAGFVAADRKTVDYLRDRVDEEIVPVASDSNAKYARVIDLDISTLEPQIALPPTPDNVRPVGDCHGTRVDWAFIAGCASSRIHDLRVAASILKNRKVHDRVRLVISPSSQEILLRALEEGLLETFIKAGAMIMPPTCGPCYGKGIRLADGEVCLGTGTRNEPGRMGSKNAQVYIGNPATVAASSVAGEIVDPREFLS